MRHQTRPFTLSLLILLLSCVWGSPAYAQDQIPPPSGPVTICFAQALPSADSWAAIVNGAAPSAVTPDTQVHEQCPSGTTHSFGLSGSIFTIGTHTVAIVSINDFGSTVGPSRTIVVGIAPGEATITGVIPPPGQ